MIAHHTISLSCIALLASLVACDKPETPTAHKDDPVSVTSEDAPSAMPSARVAPPPPTLRLERLESDEGSLSLHTITGAVVVASKDRVGRLADGKIEWLDARIPEGGIGGNRIHNVYGVWP